MMFDNAENPNIVSIMNKFIQMRVMIFGANDDGRALFHKLKPLILIKAIDVIAFIDNDSRLIGREIEGKKIIFPEQVTNYEYDLIVVAPIFFSEILRQLIDLGVSPKLAANWILGNLFSQLKDKDIDIIDSPILPEQLSKLINRIEDGTISNNAAKKVFEICREIKIN